MTREYVPRHEAGRPEVSTDRAANARKASQLVRDVHRGAHRPERGQQS
jgi:hypothetical protein